MKIEIEACFRSSHIYAILETHSACFLELNMFHLGLLYQKLVHIHTILLSKDKDEDGGNCYPSKVSRRVCCVLINKPR